ncbi:helix-turn-helix transcriptional regulator [Streptomyces sp. NEAU-PBA10]|uniref:helix-turn-helix transcriptional regulator n=1 Tax=Streptomyces sp. NEAU-PBA10 TaxID=3438640 RepID=UPI003F79B786
MNASGELATLLRAWRERLAPAEAGLTAHTGRRTSGLRREEVAVLAGVSVDYVVRLEQGRAAAPSAQVCAALARALRLSDTEQEHLFRLAGHAMDGGRINRLVPASVRRLVERTGERPVAVFDAMWDLLLWAALMGDLSTLREADRNLLWLHFTSDSDCHLHGPGSPEALDASFVADLRRSAGRCPDDPRLHRLVERLSERSEQFRELWRRPEVAEHGPTVKRITHSEVGLLELDCDILRTHRGDLRIVTYSAEPGSPSDSKLALLAAIGTQRLRAGSAD